MIFQELGYKIAIRNTLILGILIAIITFFISPYFVLDMSMMMRFGFAVLSAIIVGVFGKKTYDGIESIVNFKLKDESPSIIIEMVNSSKKTYINSLKKSSEIKSYSLTYLVLLILAMANPTFESESVNRVLSSLSVALFIVYNYFIILFILRINSQLISFKLSLDERANIEERRQKILMQLTAAKTKIDSANNANKGFTPNKNFDVQGYIERLKNKNDNKKDDYDKSEDE